MPFSIRGIRKDFGGIPVLDDIDLEVEEGKLLVILGPSGCGKTTLLRIVAGLDTDWTGRREGFDGRRFSFVFQDHRLLPWKSVVGNAMFALSGSELGSEQAIARVHGFVEKSGLLGHENRPVRELSGGMRQRAALVRAFSWPCDFLLLDEAFQSVDIKRKRDLMRIFLELREMEKCGSIVVTHDPWEALWLADSITVLSDRPAHVVDSFAVDIPKDRRDPGMPGIAELERRLLSALLDKA